MSFKNRIQILLATTALLTFSHAWGGNEGVFLYYGAGLGAMAIDEKSGFIGYDPAGIGSILVGIEEDGWALEYTGFQTTEAGTDLSAFDYKVSGSVVSLGYRTLEKGNMYYLFSYGKGKADFDLIDTATDAKATGTMDGKVITLGIGLRLQSKDRMEMNYSLYDPSSADTSFISKVHMLNFRYLFDGAPPPRH